MKVPLHFVNAESSAGVKDQGGVVSHVLNELAVACFPDDLPEFIEVDLGSLAVGHSMHVRELALPKGVALALSKDENPVVATVIVPALVTEEEEAAAVVAPSEVPTTEQAAPAKEGEAAAEGDKGKAGEKPAAKGGDKAAPPAAGDKGEKKEKK
jgi:large subunit ribosomal protein L25